MFRAWCLGFGLWVLGFGVQGLGFGVWGLTFGIEASALLPDVQRFWRHSIIAILITEKDDLAMLRHPDAHHTSYNPNS